MMDVQSMYDGLGEYFDNHGKEIDVYENGWRSSSFEAYLDDDNFILIQYTGLCDNTPEHKEIYEGDCVIEKGQGRTYKRIVVFSNGAFRLSNSKLRAQRTPQLHSSKVFNMDIKVIGNIYENPELLVPHQER